MSTFSQARLILSGVILSTTLSKGEMARPRGFEPPACASGGRRSIQLS